VRKNSKEKTMDREKLEDKLDKIDPRFRHEAVKLSVADLETKVNEYAKANEANDELQENDEELAGARAHATELARPYKEDRTAYKLKSKYAILLIKEKGGTP
jgi:hypothetical protein